MAYTKWQDVEHKVSSKRRTAIKREAAAELDRVGYGALRKARELTQVELAERLGITQASVAGLESRTDLQLSTLAKYIRALGGELEVRAVWPEGDFNLLALPEIAPAAGAKPMRAVKVRAAGRLRQAVS